MMKFAGAFCKYSLLTVPGWSTRNEKLRRERERGERAREGWVQGDRVGERAYGNEEISRQTRR
jgi:hypothetical protein